MIKNKPTLDKLPAKLCFSHVRGKLGELLFEQFVNKGWITKEKLTDKHFYITDKGKKEFAKLGIDLSQINPE